MSEKPLDRLNYYNGQRLEASDLKLEQQYHIRVRRWLNKSLYTTGIARGLEVIKDPIDLGSITVRPGLALDVEGREIILLDQKSMKAIGTASAVAGEVTGNYLFIQYNEQVTEVEQNGCVTRPGQKKSCNGTSLAWGGPAFLRAQPILGWTDILPDENSGKIVLAQVELDQQCNIRSVHPEVRRYVGAASEAKVRQYALEGEREVGSGTGPGDPTENPAIIYFHIRGREPSAVSLFLRGDTFPTLRYTEMGEHQHGLTISGSTGGAQPPLNVTHSHTLNADPSHPVAIIGNEHAHTHSTLVADYFLHPIGEGILGTDPQGAFNLVSPLILGSLGGTIALPPAVVVVPVGDNAHAHGNIFSQFPGADPTNTYIGGASDHSHTLSGATDSYQITYDHRHSLTGSGTSKPFGVTDPAFPNGPYSARSGSPLTYVNDLHILIDGHDYTDDILSQLKDSTGIDWPTVRLGNGIAGSHPFYIDPSDSTKGGTGEIKLDFLPGVSFIEGEHMIEIHSQPMADGSPTGGRILYNLYIE